MATGVLRETGNGKDKVLVMGVLGTKGTGVHGLKVPCRLYIFKLVSKGSKVPTDPMLQDRCALALHISTGHQCVPFRVRCNFRFKLGRRLLGTWVKHGTSLAIYLSTCIGGVPCNFDKRIEKCHAMNFDKSWSPTHHPEVHDIFDNARRQRPKNRPERTRSSEVWRSSTD